MIHTPQTIYDVFLASTGISTDTRTLQKGSLFFCLSGKNFNGNTFAEEAIQKGASYCIIDDAKFQKDERYILVENALKTLQDIAHIHRKKWGKRVIAITGSNGKTTTKNLITAVLSQKYSVLSTQGNLNNHIGVPLTLLQLKPKHERAVIEMGANKPGDIAELCRIADPDDGVITNISHAHLEQLGSIEGVFEEKRALYEYVISKNRFIFINEKETKLCNFYESYPHKYLFPTKHCFPQIKIVGKTQFLVLKIEGTKSFTTHIFGKYNLDNIAIAVMFGYLEKVDREKIEKALKNFVFENNRSQVIQKGTNTIILDAYNANPDSMKSALSHFKTIEASKKVYIIGDMFELGEHTQKAHKNIGKLLQNLIGKRPNITVLFCGKNMKHASDQMKKSHYFESREALQTFLSQTKFQHTFFLIKASRGMELEKVMEFL
ncbi:MAG: UDP-N-acetylmuramoyl-tripeptide--D-alanyl-D-alanine ligase [Chitinophagaceae bacterium]|nr:UDP-N-acetylmuramoyl-tripeptide--D-alanyl-D-alanine ligase [Chitinophagaceae bacterium]